MSKRVTFVTNSPISEILDYLNNLDINELTIEEINLNAPNPKGKG